MPSEAIAQLYDENLAIWREIKRRMWIAETGDDEYNVREKENLYNARINFLLKLVDDFGIDGYRPWTVSEITGHVYYTDEGGEEDGSEGESEGGSRDLDQSSSSESERSERRSERDSG